MTIPSLFELSMQTGPLAYAHCIHSTGLTARLTALTAVELVFGFWVSEGRQRLLVAVRRHAASLGFVGDIPADIFVRIVLHLDPVSLSTVEACNPVRSFVRFTRTNA